MSRQWILAIHSVTFDSVGERIPPELRSAVGERIRARRIELGLTTTQLGKMLENANGGAVDRTQIARWERGINLPAQRYWAQIAAKLRLEVGQLFAGLTDQLPEWSVALANRVERLERQQQALIRLLGLEAAVPAAEHVPQLSERQRQQWDAAAAELESERSAEEGPASGSRPASG